MHHSTLVKWTILSVCAVLLSACVHISPNATWSFGTQPVVVPMRMLRTAEIGGVPLVAVQIAGRSYTFILDSGSSEHLITTELVQKLGLKPIRPTRLRGFGGIQQALVYQLPKIAIGGLTIKGHRAIGVDLTSIVGRFGEKIDGILGRPLFEEIAVTLAYLDQQVIFHPPNIPRSASGGTSFPLYFTKNRLPVLELKRLNKLSGRFILDTGNAGALILFPAQLARMGLGESLQNLPSIKDRVLGGEVQMYFGLLPKIQLGEIEIQNVPAALQVLTDKREMGEDFKLSGDIGSAILSFFNLTIDYPKKRIVFSHRHKKIKIPGGFGLLFNLKDHQFVVSHVISKSPAARAGIREGDTLLEIDTRNLPPTLAGIWEMLIDREQVKFSFLRSEISYKVEIKRQDYLPILSLK